MTVQCHEKVEQPQSPAQGEGDGGEDLTCENREDGAVDLHGAGAIEEQVAEGGVVVLANQAEVDAGVFRFCSAVRNDARSRKSEDVAGDLARRTRRHGKK